MMSQHRFEPTFRTCRYSKAKAEGEFKSFSGRSRTTACNVGDIFNTLFKEMFPDTEDLLGKLTRGILSESGNFIMNYMSGKITVTNTYVKIENFMTKSWKTVTTQQVMISIIGTRRYFNVHLTLYGRYGC